MNAPNPAPPPLTVVINEVAWSGTAANIADEWLELLNTTTQTITLDGWVITSTSDLNIPLDGTTIGPNAYYLIERTDDTTISDIAADLIASFDGGLVNTGGRLFLSKDGTIIDTANVNGGPWPAGTAAPDYFSMERLNPTWPDSDANWGSNDGLTRNGLDAAFNLINGTPKQPNAAKILPAALILIGEFLYDGLTPATEGDEFVELCNPNPEAVDMTGYKVGDEEVSGGGESMYELPAGLVLAAGDCLVIAKSAADFQDRFGVPPNFELTDLNKYTTWTSGGWALSNTADELLVLGPGDQIVDSVAYGSGDYAILDLEPEAAAAAPHSLQRVWPIDTDSMPHDFVRADPNPGAPTVPPSPPALAPSPAVLPDGMNAYWGHLHAHTTYSDGAGPPHYALALARAAGLHFYAITDRGRDLTQAQWTKTLSQTEAATVPGQFVALRGVEWSHNTAGHLNVFNSDILISQTNPMFHNLSDFYAWLAATPQAVAQFNHPDPDYGGTFNDFAFHPGASRGVFLQEIGHAGQDYTTYEPAFVQSNAVGWRVAPTINGDLHSTDWEGRTGLVTPALTQNDLLDAIRARRVFATEDSNLALALRIEGAWMGSILATRGTLPLTVDVVDPDPEPLTLFIYDNNLLLTTVSLNTSTGQWTTTVNLLPGHYYWVKAVQTDGDVAYSAPIWTTGEAPPDTIYVNEILPAPGDNDWDGNGVADSRDEWLELFNPMDRPVGLGGWRLSDASGAVYNIPLGVTIPAGGFVILYHTQTNIAFNNDGDTLTLLHPNGTVIDNVSYDHSPGYDESWCRLPDAGDHWSEECIPSPGGANWERPPAEPLEVKIYEAKQLTHNAWVRVKGHVTAPPDLLGTRMMYIQDDTAGIMIYLPQDHRLFFNLGDKVKLEGKVRTYREEFEIAVTDPKDVSFIEFGAPPPPLPIATTSLLEPYEGRLVMLQGLVVRFQGRSTLWLDDGTDPAKVYIRSSTGIKKPFIEFGAPLTAVGIVSQYSDKDNPSRDDYRLLPRYPFDLILPDSPTPPSADWPVLLPETGG